MNLLEGLTASIMYNHSYSVEEKMSLLLIMYDFSNGERISISELLILIQSCIRTFAKIEKI